MRRLFSCCSTGTRNEETSQSAKEEMQRGNLAIHRESLDVQGVFDENSTDNCIFPWLTQKYVSESRHEQYDRKDAETLCKAKQIYKFLACFKSTQTSQIFFAIMKEVDIFCNVKLYKSLGISEYLQAMKEVQVLDLVQGCPFFVHILECFKTMGGHYLVTEEFGHTTLHNLLIDNSFLAGHELGFFACELVAAIEYLHKEGIIHRSLTANNVGVTSAGHIKLFDIENSYMKLDDGEIVKGRTKTSGVVGKDAYMSPEMARQGKYTNKVDWWALGVILYMLAQGKMPFTGKGRGGLITSILYAEIDFVPGIHTEVTVDLVYKLLNKDPVFRLGDGEVKQHAFFKDIDWAIVEALGYDPPFPSQEHHITHMPAELFSSQEYLPRADSISDLIEDNAKWYKNLARRRSQRPLRYADYELEGDWTRFLNPSHNITKSMVYVWPHLHVPSNGKEVYDTVEDSLLKYPYAEAVNLKIKDQTSIGSLTDFTLFVAKSTSLEDFYTPPETNSDRSEFDSRGDITFRRDRLNTVAHLQSMFESPKHIAQKSRKSVKYSLQATSDDTFDDIDDDPFKYDYDDEPIERTVPLGGLLRQQALAGRPILGKRRAANMKPLTRLGTFDDDDYS